MLCLGNISKDLTTDNKTKTRLKWSVNVFSADYDNDSNDILDIYRYLMKKKRRHKIMFEFIKKNVYCIFI